MQNQLNELKQKMLEFFQLVKSGRKLLLVLFCKRMKYGIIALAYTQ